MYRQRRKYGRRRRRKIYYPRGYARLTGAYGMYTLNREKKFYDGNITGTPGVTWTNLYNSINLVQPGTGPDDRIGDKVWIHSVHMKLDITFDWLSTATQLQAGAVRLFLAIDKQCNGANPTASEVMQTGGQNILQFRDVNKIKRYTILFDKTFVSNPISDDSTLNVRKQIYWKFNKKFKKPILIDFDGVSGGISEVVSNNLFVGMVTSGATGVGVGITAQTRIRFTD